MTTHTKALIGAGIVAAMTVGGFFAFLAHADTNEAGIANDRFGWRLAQLGLTDQQRMQVKTILRSYQPTVGPLVKEVVTERRALRDAIRAEAAKVASLEADLAVQRAHVAHDIRAVLTPEQIQKLKDMQMDADARFDGFLQHIANRIATD